MRRNPPIVTLIAILTVGFLYLPLLAVAVFSVNATRYGLIWKGFTLDWYIRLFHNPLILEAALNTLILAVVSTLIATVLGTLLAIGLDRFPWGKKTNSFLDIVLHIPVVIPDIILAAALVVAFGLLRFISSIFEPGLFNMIIAHITFQIAFVALVVRSSAATERFLARTRLRCSQRSLITKALTESVTKITVSPTLTMVPAIMKSMASSFRSIALIPSLI